VHPAGEGRRTWEYPGAGAGGGTSCAQTQAGWFMRIRIQSFDFVPTLEKGVEFY
jgi:hypothetical protein